MPRRTRGSAQWSYVEEVRGGGHDVLLYKASYSETLHPSLDSGANMSFEKRAPEAAIVGLA